jgi:hypothetical protein
LADDFLEHGEGVIQKVRAERPHDDLKIIASLPKQIELGPEKPLKEMTDEELTAIIRDGEKARRDLIAAGYLEPDPKSEEQAAWC